MIASLVAWGIIGFVALVVGYLVIWIPFNIECARGGDGAVRRTVAHFHSAIAARNWDAACDLLTDGQRRRFAEEARLTYELSPTCAAGLQLAVRQGALRPGRIEKVSAPWVYDDATVTTTNERYHLKSPDNTCRYLISRSD